MDVSTLKFGATVLLQLGRDLSDGYADGAHADHTFIRQ